MLEGRPDTASAPVIVIGSPSPRRPGSAIEASASSTLPLDRAVVSAVGRALSDPRLEPVFLVVGADPELTEGLVSGLSRRGVRTAHAGTIADACAWCTKIAPDAIILDLDLPDGDGTGFIQWMRDRSNLSGVDLVVYGRREMAPMDRLRLAVGDEQVFVTSHMTPEVVVQHVVGLARLRAPQELGV
jgi:CheY-like chemotaxis protein